MNSTKNNCNRSARIVISSECEKSCSQDIQFQPKRFLPLVEMTEEAMGAELLPITLSLAIRQMRKWK